MNVLIVQSSINIKSSASRLLINYIMKNYLSHHNVCVRDLIKSPPPHLTYQRFQAINTSPAHRTSMQKKLTLIPEQMLNEFKIAHLIIIGCPVYNHGIPSQLKTYCDYVIQSIRSLSDQQKCQEILNTNVLIILSAGGEYKNKKHNFSSFYLTYLLNTVGIKAQTIFCDMLAYQRQESIEQAKTHIDQYFQNLK